MHKLRTIEMKRLTVEEFRSARKLPLTVVLDDVRSLYNVGSVFRTADAFRVAGICLCGITACPPSAEIHKTALGAEDSVAWRYFKTADEALEALHREGVFVWSVEQVEGSTKLQHLARALQEQASADGALPAQAIVMGNEVKGVSQSVVDHSDGCLEIPQFGTKHSLNVSTTAGIVIWEFAKALGLRREVND